MVQDFYHVYYSRVCHEHCNSSNYPLLSKGKRVLSLSNVISTNGDGILLSIKTNMANEIAETIKAIPICGRVLEFIPLCISVSAIRNEIIVIESTKAPFMSIEGDVYCSFLPVLC